MFVASYSTKYLDFEASSSSLSRCSSSSSLFFLLRKPNPQGFRLWFSLSLPKFNPKSPKSLPNPNPQTPNLFCLPLSPRMDMLIFIDHRNIMVSSSDVNPVGLGRRSRQLFDQVWRKFSGLGQISRTSLPDERDALDALLIREGPMCEFVIPGAQNTTVLVVGATSKIGRIVVRKLMLRGYTVKALVRKADQEVVYTHYSLVNGVGEAVKQVSQTKLLQVVLVSPQTGEVYTWGWKECVPSETVFPDSVQVDQDIFESLRSNINCRRGGDDVAKRRKTSSAKLELESSTASDELFMAMPCLVTMGPGVRITTVAAGGRHTLALSGNTKDQLKVVRVDSLSDNRVKSVAAGLWHTLCITEDGHVYAFGGNQFGQLGTGAEESETPPRLLDSSGLDNKHAKAVSCGARHSTILTEDGCLLSWGWNKYGQLGLGDSVDRNLPCQVPWPGHTLLLAERAI